MCGRLSHKFNFKLGSPGEDRSAPSSFEHLIGSQYRSLLRSHPLPVVLISAASWGLICLNCPTFAIPVGEVYIGDRKPVIHKKLGLQKPITETLRVAQSQKFTEYI